MIQATETEITFTGQDVYNLINALAVLKGILQAEEKFDQVLEFCNKFGKTLEADV